VPRYTLGLQTVNTVMERRSKYVDLLQAFDLFTLLYGICCSPQLNYCCRKNPATASCFIKKMAEKRQLQFSDRRCKFPTEKKTVNAQNFNFCVKFSYIQINK